MLRRIDEYVDNTG